MGRAMTSEMLANETYVNKHAAVSMAIGRHVAFPKKTDEIFEKKLSSSTNNSNTDSTRMNTSINVPGFIPANTSLG